MKSPSIIVAGHICLDIIPEILVEKNSMAELIEPGKLLAVGPVVTSTGGAVANTGLALHKMGYSVRLMGKVGADPFGDVLLGHLKRISVELSDSMVVDSRCNTSYTVVISPPGIDRAFLHCPGANDTFGALDIDEAKIKDAAIFHFGYPPLMKRLYSDGGVELAAILGKAATAVTSLDMAMPDPDSPAGRVDWRAILRRIMPLTDVFLPSYEEIACMLGIDNADKLAGCREIARWLIDAGAAVIAIKAGEDGLFVRSSDSASRIEKLVRLCGVDGKEWRGRELWAPCFQINVVGTTGSGDATIAGFIGALAGGADAMEAAAMATAVGACACEAPDATGGILSRQETLARMRGGWKKRKACIRASGWNWSDENQMWIGPDDRTS